MVGSCTRTRDNLKPAMRILRCLGENGVEKRRIHRARARERRERAIGLQKLHRKKVDVLVSARRLHELPLSRGELRGVKDDEIELPPRVAALPEELEYIGLDILHLRAAVVLKRLIFLRERKRIAGNVDLRH